MLRYQVSHVSSRTPFSTLRATSTRDSPYTCCTIYTTRTNMEEGCGKPRVLFRGSDAVRDIFFTDTLWLNVKLFTCVRIFKAHFIKGLGDEFSLALAGQGR